MHVPQLLQIISSLTVEHTTTPLLWGIHSGSNHPGDLKQNFESFLSTGVGVKF